MGAAMQQLRFLHTGDIHLGAPIRGLRNLDEQWSRRLQEAIPEAFERMVRTAVDLRVDFVIIAGDAFDASKASYRDFKLFFEGLQKLDAAGIPAYIVAGNHDPSTSWMGDADLLPPTAHLMGVGEPTFQLFRREGEPLCLIGARSYYNQTWPQDKDIAEGISRAAAEAALIPGDPDAVRAPFSVGIIHTGLDVDRQKAPASEADLLARGIDYWACGHLHKNLVRPSVHDPRIVFPGCIQGRNIKETGKRGCYLATLEGGSAGPRASLEFIPLASVVFEGLEVDCGPFRTLTDLEHHIQTEMFRRNGDAHCEDMVVRVTLAGSTELYGYLADETVLERIRKRLNDAYPNFYCDSIANRTRPAIDCGLQRREGLFPSLVMEMADEQRARDDEMVNYIQSEFVKRGITVPESLSRRIGDFEDAAELRVLNLLEEDER